MKVASEPLVDSAVSKAKAWALFALAATVCVAALYVRHPYAFKNPQFYAEDGKYFFADAYNDGWRSIFYTANGYFHLLPRLVANVALSLGLSYQIIPAVFTYSCVVVYLSLWSYIFVQLPLSATAKFFLVLSTMLVPLGNEILMNQTNLQWVMAFFPVVIFCARNREHKWWKALEWLALILCVFTGPYVLLLFPAFLLVSLRDNRLREDSVFLGISLAASAACLVGLRAFGTVNRVPGDPNTSAFGFVQLFFYQYSFPILLSHIHDFSQRSVVVISAAILVLLLALSVKVYRSGNRLATVSLVAGATCWLATAISYGRNPSLLEPFSYGIRNFYLPMVFLLWALIAVTTFHTLSKVVWVAVFGWFAMQTAVFVKDSRAFADLQWEKYARRIDAKHSLTVPINPPGWEMKLEKR